MLYGAILRTAGRPSTFRTGLANMTGTPLVWRVTPAASVSNPPAGVSGRQFGFATRGATSTKRFTLSHVIRVDRPILKASSDPWLISS